MNGSAVSAEPIKTATPTRKAIRPMMKTTNETSLRVMMGGRSTPRSSTLIPPVFLPLGEPLHLPYLHAPHLWEDPVVPLDSGREAVEDRRSADREDKPMDDLAIRRRVERTIQMCHAFDIEPDARTVAEIMVDEDTAAAEYEPLSAERALVFVEYEKAAARALRRLRVDRRSA